MYCPAKRKRKRRTTLFMVNTQNNGFDMAAGIHYFRDGTKYRGAVHKHKDGTIMTGAQMTPKSKKVLHFSQLSDTAKKKARKR